MLAARSTAPLAAVLPTLAFAASMMGCGGEGPAPKAPPVRQEARPATPPGPEPSRSALRPPAGAPTVELPRATLWADPGRGLIVRAERVRPPEGMAGEAGWGEVTVLARDRNAPGHLVREWDGDLYWVEYRRADARCDFVRLPNGASTPERLFEHRFGDFSETICDTAIAIDGGARHLFWVQGAEIRAAPALAGAAPTILAREQPYPRELATDVDHVYWIALGGDPYEDDLTGTGSLRAVPIAGGPVRILAEGLTEPHDLVITGTAVELREQIGDEEPTRQYLLAGPPVTP